MMLPRELAEALSHRFGDRAQFGERLAPYLAYGVGGPADVLVFPSDVDDLVWIADRARNARVPITVIGEGTNLLVLDGGVRGVVISLERAFRKIDIVRAMPDGGALIRCGGGVRKPELLDWAIDHGFAGLEFSSGVPGTIGGGIFMNAGTKYGCYGDILTRLTLFDFKAGPRELTREQAHFGYREQTAVGDSLVLWAELSLKAGDPAALRKERDRIIRERAEKQPLDFPSCGSTFKNPPGLSAGRLIERAGLKGLCVGGAEISDKHANFILNKGGASALDILTLIGIAKDRVYNEHKVHLECEVIVLGSA